MLGKLAELFLFGLAPFAFAGLLMPAATAAEEVAIAGEASPRERVALPPGALRMVSQDAGAAPAALFDTVWLAEDIGGGGVIDDAQSTFTVAPDGKVTGGGGCNRFFARAKVEGDRISIGKAGATMMACPEALMDQERKFFAALEKAATYRLDGDGKLFLVDANGADIARFARAG